MTVLRPRLTTLGRAQPRPLTSERSWARHYRFRLIATDTLIILVSTIGAIFVRFGFEDTPTTPGHGFRVDYLTVSLLIAVTWMFTLAAYHTRDARVVGVGVVEYRRVVAATAITFGLLAIFFLVGKVDIARGYFVLALPLGMGGVLFSRWLWRHWLIKQRSFDHYLSRALVVGRYDDVDTVVRQIHQKSGAAYNVVGAALDTGKRKGAKTDAELSRRIASPEREVPVVSDLSGVAEAAARPGARPVIGAGRARGGGDVWRRGAW